MNRYTLFLFALMIIGCGDRDGEKKLGDDEGATSAAISAPFRWGHFGAVLPCIDCEKRRLNTMLWSTGSALVRDEHVNTPDGTELEHHWGNWKKDGDVITIYHLDEPIYKFKSIAVDTVMWLDEDDASEPSKHFLSRQSGTLTPGIELEVIGTYYAPQDPRIANVRECASGKNFLVRLDPNAADIQSRFQELNINLVAGIPARMFGRLRPVEMVDNETGADMLVFEIKSWSEFLPDHKCLQ